jgi:hypothetical protein
MYNCLIDLPKHFNPLKAMLHILFVRFAALDLLNGATISFSLQKFIYFFSRLLRPSHAFVLRHSSSNISEKLAFNSLSLTFDHIIEKHNFLLHNLRRPLL